MKSGIRFNHMGPQFAVENVSRFDSGYSPFPIQRGTHFESVSPLNPLEAVTSNRLDCG